MSSTLRDRAAGQEVATTDQNQNLSPAQEREQSLIGMVHNMRHEIQRALPAGMSGDRIARLALTAIRRDPNLGQCTPESFMGSLLTASALGLEPNVAGEAYLVPYKRECTLIVGYQGFVKLFWQSPLAKHLDAQAVYENDDFDYELGLEPFLRHKPARENRGEIIYYYAVGSLNTGASKFVVLTPEDIKALRQGKVGPSPKFQGGDPQKWMERKTALRQLFKLLPRSTQLDKAIDSDEKSGTVLRHNMLAEQQATKAIEAPDPAPAGVNTETGEVVDDSQEQPADPWATDGETEGAKA